VEQVYAVNEMFATVQGEGAFTGTAAIFVRLQGCDVGCPWCDTKHTWAFPDRLRRTGEKPREAAEKPVVPSDLLGRSSAAPKGSDGSSAGTQGARPALLASPLAPTASPPPAGNRVWIPVMLNKGHAPTPDFAEMLAEEIVQNVSRVAAGRAVSHVVLTGGEPAMHDLSPLIAALRAAGYFVQVESSGTYPLPLERTYWLTLSPKLEMPGGRSVLPQSWQRADEIKLPVGKVADVERLLAQKHLWGSAPAAGRIYLQPLSQSIKSTAICVEQALMRGWRVSVQTHKYLGLR